MLSAKRRVCSYHAEYLALIILNLKLQFCIFGYFCDPSQNPWTIPLQSWHHVILYSRTCPMHCPSSCSVSRSPPSASHYWPAAAWSGAQPRLPWVTWSVQRSHYYPWLTHSVIRNRTKDLCCAQNFSEGDRTFANVIRSWEVYDVNKHFTRDPHSLLHWVLCHWFACVITHGSLPSRVM